MPFKYKISDFANLVIPHLFLCDYSNKQKTSGIIAKQDVIVRIPKSDDGC